MHQRTLEIKPLEEIPKDKLKEYIELDGQDREELETMSRRERRAWLRERKKEIRKKKKAERNANKI